MKPRLLLKRKTEQFDALARERGWTPPSSTQQPNHKPVSGQGEAQQREIDEPDEHGVTPLDEAIVEDFKSSEGEGR